jgi:pyridoxal phosphate enzyme (YggS family)
MDDKLLEIQERIAKAARAAGREPEDIQLIGVSKTVDVERINAMIDRGLARIGENRVQELLSKLPELHPVEVHLIGQLQSNKVHQIVDKVALIHSLDRLSLMEEIQRQAAKRGIVTPVLIEINIGREESKGGLMEEELPAFLDRVVDCPNLEVRGLMCIAPLVADPETARPYFARMRELAEKIRSQRDSRIQMVHLSMGMSHDFEAAIQEGATMVRVGRALFGARA